MPHLLMLYKLVLLGHRCVSQWVVPVSISVLLSEMTFYEPNVTELTVGRLLSKS